VLIDKVIKEAYGKIGSAGGHDTSAGAQIPLDKIHMGDKSDKELVADIVSNMTKKLFFNAMGIDIPSKTV
jgi:nanoRNase/pAp phosphatase (c-di-AMP/oligoRNAs hydrolase)